MQHSVLNINNLSSAFFPTTSYQQWENKHKTLNIGPLAPQVSILTMALRADCENRTIQSCTANGAKLKDLRWCNVSSLSRRQRQLGHSARAGMEQLSLFILGLKWRRANYYHRKKKFRQFFFLHRRFYIYGAIRGSMSGGGGVIDSPDRVFRWCDFKVNLKTRKNW